MKKPSKVITLDKVYGIDICEGSISKFVVIFDYRDVEHPVFCMDYGEFQELLKDFEDIDNGILK